ncbi:hypothetical protein NYS52_07395 [Curtobacterium flaccumfaciens pv. flaccumfaciens]|uniref:hypothetical protein n=1 Tax=Curtobacterium poinsettiae TaxID=159612 RepID=UPI00217E7EB3|nr:hypothetical protein [Curtobacterium flaccumfaciens]MCS6574344.1 hypothetical protein [Curtobacterium flaccumfaciens pv. flaccumfaciens]
MSKIKQALAGMGMVVALAGGGVVLPAAAAPAHAGPVVCHTWTETVHAKNCDKKRQICTAYIYHRICD